MCPIGTDECCGDPHMHMSRIAPDIEQVINGKKVEGYEVLPISDGNTQYRVLSEFVTDEKGSYTGQQLFVEASDSQENAVWKTKYYEKDFIPGLEEDVQFVYPVDFYFDENGRDIVVKNEFYTETEGVFRVDKASGSLK